MSDTLLCPHCHEKLWVAPIQVPLVTCPRCLGVVVNPNAASDLGEPPPIPQRRTEPRDVIPLEQEAAADLHGTLGAMLVLGLILLVGGVGAVFLLGRPGLSVILVGAGLMTAGGVIYSNRRREAGQDLPAALPGRGGGILEYQQVRPRMSVLAFLGGFFIAIVIGIICFFALAATGERTSVSTRRLVFSGMIVLIVGLIFAAINLRRRPGWMGFGRGVAIGLALAMMALGPCAACYMLTLFG